MKIAIDFGQTTTHVAYVSSLGKPIVKSNDRDEKWTPSVVAIIDGLPFVGNDIWNFDANENNVVSKMKGIIGRIHNINLLEQYCKDWRINMQREGDTPKFFFNDENDDGLTVVEIMALLFIYVTHDLKEGIISKIAKRLPSLLAKAISSSSTDVAVLTVPSSFDDKQRQMIKDAAAIANLPVSALIDETTAAAKAFAMAENSGKKRNLLVFQMGGGSIDIAVFEVTGTRVKLLGNAASSRLGGDDFDKNVLEEVNKHQTEYYGEWMKLMKDCERAKKDLGLGDDVSTKVKNEVLTNERFKEINKTLLSQINVMLTRALSEAITPEDKIDEYILVGNCSLMPSVADIVESRIGKHKQKYLVNADEAAVIGAVHHANQLATEQSSRSDIIKVIEERQRIYESKLSVHEESQLAKPFIVRSMRTEKASDDRDGVGNTSDKKSLEKSSSTANTEKPSSEKTDELMKKKNAVLKLKSLKIAAMDLISSVELLKQKKDKLEQHQQQAIEDIRGECCKICHWTDDNISKKALRDEEFNAYKEEMDALKKKFQKAYDEVHSKKQASQTTSQRLRSSVTDVVSKFSSTKN